MRSIMHGDRIRRATGFYFGYVSPGWKLCVALGCLYLLQRMLVGAPL